MLYDILIHQCQNGLLPNPLCKREARTEDCDCRAFWIRKKYIGKVNEPNEGTISFDGISIQELDLSSLRKQIGVVS